MKTIEKINKIKVFEAKPLIFGNPPPYFLHIPVQKIALGRARKIFIFFKPTCTNTQYRNCVILVAKREILHIISGVAVGVLSNDAKEGLVAVRSGIEGISSPDMLREGFTHVMDDVATSRGWNPLGGVKRMLPTFSSCHPRSSLPIPATLSLPRFLFLNE